ncbi:MAG: response regulator transcription factor [Elusimicrobia bacterium]|nr:response regulator transcription factor [Elusimicrobiota bacterium]
MKILIVDKRNLIRNAFVSLLKQIKNITIVGETDNIDECLKLCKKNLPDIVLAGEIDATLIKGNITHQIKSKCPKVHVLIVTEEQRNAMLDDFASGADGYISSSWSSKELENALNHFHREGILIPRKMAIRLVKELKEKPGFQRASLTPMEAEILRLLCQGKLNKEIAGILGKNEKSIKNYLHVIYIKLGVTRRSEAIAKVFSGLKVL